MRVQKKCKVCESCTLNQKKTKKLGNGTSKGRKKINKCWKTGKSRKISSRKIGVGRKKGK